MNRLKIHIVFFFAFILLFPTLSLAHAYVVRSSPPESVIKPLITRVAIQIDESIRPTFIERAHKLPQFLLII
ncbi:hypothetical protein QS257_19815 [Terrilactibacillus sp. S3-3]|nr:hypothetical protein QS257_19815 [Terrilactibacillus sp. S3-3]